MVCVGAVVSFKALVRMLSRIDEQSQYSLHSQYFVLNQD
jgi:hypothetical protein